MSLDEVEDKIYAAQEAGYFDKFNGGGNGADEPETSQVSSESPPSKPVQRAIPSGQPASSGGNSQPPQQQSSVEFPEWEYGGRKWRPDQIKSVEDWNALQKAVHEGTLRHADYTRKTQETAELKRRAEEAEKVYSQLMDGLMDPQRGRNIMMELARRGGWKIPMSQEQFNALEHDPYAKHLQRIEAIESEFKRRDYEVALERKVAEIGQTWNTIKASTPGLTDRHQALWLAYQSQTGMSAEEAAARIGADLNQQWSYESFEKSPAQARQALEKRIIDSYLNQKRQSRNVQTIAGPGGTTAETLAQDGPPKGATVEQQRDWFEAKMAGRSSM